jgi:hypothetical protein
MWSCPCPCPWPCPVQCSSAGICSGIACGILFGIPRCSAEYRGILQTEFSAEAKTTSEKIPTSANYKNPLPWAPYCALCEEAPSNYTSSSEGQNKSEKLLKRVESSIYASNSERLFQHFRSLKPFTVVLIILLLCMLLDGLPK